MLDVAILRSDPDALATSLTRRGIRVDVAALAGLDERRRSARVDAERLRSEQKDLGKSIARLEGEAKTAALARASELSTAYKTALADADELDAAFEEQWVTLPNLADATAAVGASEDDNVEVKRWGEPTSFGFTGRDHLEIGEGLGAIDVERGVKVSGSRFAYLKGPLALLEFALVRWGMDMLAPHGFVPIVPPVLVRDQALFGTGFFPGDREQVYAVEADDLYLVGTSEVPLAAMHADEIFDEADLPTRYAGFSTCFRREAGTYGRDMRGIFRVHQFDKLEMFTFCHPDDSQTEHDFLLAREEEIVQALEIPYRVVNVCTGDLGSSAAKKYDIEAWIPSQDTYREITSTSNTTDYQARRLKIRYRSDDGNRLVHTLNGTALAVGRTLIALLENHQQEDGSVRIPAAIVPYAGFDVMTPVAG